MTTTTANYNEFSYKPFVIAILLVLLGVGIYFASIHSIEKHGIEAEKVEECIKNNGVEVQLVNPETGRKALICFVDDIGKWGIQINEANGENVTNFIKNKMRSLDQVINYLQNRGYFFSAQSG